MLPTWKGRWPWASTCLRRVSAGLEAKGSTSSTCFKRKQSRCLVAIWRLLLETLRASLIRACGAHRHAVPLFFHGFPCFSSRLGTFFILFGYRNGSSSMLFGPWSTPKRSTLLLEEVSKGRTSPPSATEVLGGGAPEPQRLQRVQLHKTSKGVSSKKPCTQTNLITSIDDILT